MTPGAALAEGALLGLASTGHCLGVCGPALLPLVTTAAERGVNPWRTALSFQGGRATGYALVLLGAAVVGYEVGEARWAQHLTAWSLIALSLALAVWALVANLPELKLCRLVERWEPLARAPLALGVLVGLSPCPPLLLVAAAVARSDGLAVASVTALSFVLATTVPALALGALGVGRFGRSLGGVGRAAALLSSVWFLAQGVTALPGPQGGS